MIGYCESSLGYIEIMEICYENWFLKDLKSLAKLSYRKGAKVPEDAVVSADNSWIAILFGGRREVWLYSREDSENLSFEPRFSIDDGDNMEVSWMSFSS